jgi:hypothetical protein
MSGGEEYMATITVSVTVSKNLATLDAASIAAVITWVQTNIKEKLPSDCNLAMSYVITP